MTRLQSTGAHNNGMTQLVLEVTPYPKRKGVSSSKPHYDTALGIKCQDIFCFKEPHGNKLELPTKSKLSTEPQLLSLQKHVEKQVQRIIDSFNILLNIHPVVTMIRYFCKNHSSSTFTYCRVHLRQPHKPALNSYALYLKDYKSVLSDTAQQHPEPQLEERPNQYIKEVH